MTAFPLSLTGKRWNMREGSLEVESGAGLVERLKLQRGLTDDASGSSWEDPELFPDSLKAAARVHRAMDAREMIGIFGDYDCDGITSTAQLVRYFRRHGLEPIVRLPHRVHDGYGLKTCHVDECHAAGVRLLITVDTGINAHDAIAEAATRGIDVIVLDHHHFTSSPPAYAVLHPVLARNRFFSDAPPSAAGVVWHFLHTLEGSAWLDRDTDMALAMIGTVADLVVLRGSNRMLVREGLRALDRLRGSPLAELAQYVSSGSTLRSTDVAFRLAPRINAAGRMSDPTHALTALLEGGTALRELEELNTLRQEETHASFEHALGAVAGSPLQPLLAVADTTYSPGIIGLIAGKLTERFGRPSMAVHIAGSTCTGSIRSPAAYDLTTGLDRIRPLCLSIGGHAHAAGCTFTLDNYFAITDLLCRDVEERVKASSLHPSMQIDAVLRAAYITGSLVTRLQELEPYGQENPEPQFLVQDIILDAVRTVGSERQHLQASIGNAKVIGFHLGRLATHCKSPVDLVCRLGMNTWNGRTQPQLVAQDMRLANALQRHQNQEVRIMNKENIPAS